MLCDRSIHFINAFCRHTWRPTDKLSARAHTLVAGCDKRLSTCRGTFANALNFQGFPHMPGNDFVVRYAPGAGPGLDGGSLFR